MEVCGALGWAHNAASVHLRCTNMCAVLYSCRRIAISVHIYTDAVQHLPWIQERIRLYIYGSVHRKYPEHTV